MEPYDLIVIGAGSAARDAANKASREYGARVALVERTRWGGSCPNVACKPTKAYLVAATHPLANVTRSQYVAERHGLYKLVYAYDTRRVLGIHVVSRGASDIVQGLSLALRLGLTVDDLARSHHVYPSWGEGVKSAAERARPSPTASAQA